MAVPAVEASHLQLRAARKEPGAIAARRRVGEMVPAQVLLFQFLQVFDCKRLMSHVPHSAAFGLHPHVSLFQFLEVFHCKGLMSHVPHSAAFGLDQMCFKMFRNSSF